MVHKKTQQKEMRPGKPFAPNIKNLERLINNQLNSFSEVILIIGENADNFYIVIKSYNFCSSFITSSSCSAFNCALLSFDPLLPFSPAFGG